MKIAVIGAGAMGSLYGAKLSESPENEVILIDIWKDHIEEINKNGLIIEKNGETIHYNRLKGTLDASEAGICDLAIVFVKSKSTSEGIKSNKAVFGPDTVALTLQNGLGNIDIISKEIGAQNVIGGTTAHGATVLGPGRIFHAGSGKTIIGELNGETTNRIRIITDTFAKAGLEIEISNNVLGLIWDKLLVNVGINALTGITGLNNGELLDYPEIEILLEAAVQEAHSVAIAKGIKLSYPDPVGHTKEVCKATAANKSSMLQDILNKKQTEIDMINGMIVQEGTSLGISTPVNLTLTNLIRFIQRGIK